MMMVGLKFVLLGVKKELGSGGINLAIGITNFVGRLNRTVVIHNANNNGRDASAIEGVVNNILGRERGRGIGREFRLCRVNWGVVTGRK